MIELKSRWPTRHLWWLIHKNPCPYKAAESSTASAVIRCGTSHEHPRCLPRRPTTLSLRWYNPSGGVKEGTWLEMGLGAERDKWKINQCNCDTSTYPLISSENFGSLFQALPTGRHISQITSLSVDVDLVLRTKNIKYMCHDWIIISCILMTGTCRCPRASSPSYFKVSVAFICHVITIIIYSESVGQSGEEQPSHGEAG